MGQRVLAERGGRGGWRGIGRECGEGRGRLGAGGEELFSVRRECFAEGHVLWDVRNRLRAASNEDVPWAHAFFGYHTHPDPRFENPKVLFGKIPEINTLIRLEVECEFASIPGIR